MTELLCSVVIPSCERPALLETTLLALARQTVPPQAFEVLVVLDGPNEASVDMLRSGEAAGLLPELRWHAQAQRGQAAARNAGVARARAQIIVFLDDDVVPRPRTLEAHLRHHRGGHPVAVLGDSRIVRRTRTALHEQIVWAWWEDFLTQRSRPGQAPGYRDFCAGNVSVRKTHFDSVGGFDERFRGYGGEDYDLGYRLLKAGVRFVPEPDALADHHHISTTAQRLGNQREEAHGDVLIGRKHPELRRTLRLADPPHGRLAWLVRLAFRHPDAVAAATDAWQHLLPLLERWRLRRRWMVHHAVLQTLAYWRGVAEELGTWSTLERFVEEAPEPSRTRIDVAEGIPWDVGNALAGGPSVVDVTVSGHSLGELHLPEPVLDNARRHLAEEIVRRPWSVLLFLERRPGTGRDT